MSSKLDQLITREQAASIMDVSPTVVWNLMRYGRCVYGHDRRILLRCKTQGRRLMTTLRLVRAFQEDCDRAERDSLARREQRVPFAKAVND